MDGQSPHHRFEQQHSFDGPHTRRLLSRQELDRLLRWLNEREADPKLSIRDAADFVKDCQPLADRLIRAVGSARYGNIEVATATHAIAILGVRQTWGILRSFAEFQEQQTE